MADSTLEDNTTPHGCLVQAKWEWTTNVSAGRWSNKQQAIKPNRLSIPVSSEQPFNDGHGIRHSKLKIRGHGKSLVLRFESEDGKDFQLLGWQIPFTAETVE